MKIQIKSASHEKAQHNCYIYPIFSDSKITSHPKALQPLIKQLKASKKLTGKTTDCVIFPNPSLKKPAFIGFIGLGKKASFNEEEARVSFGNVIRLASSYSIKKCTFSCPLTTDSEINAFLKGGIEGAILGSYTIAVSKEDSTPNSVETCEFILNTKRISSTHTSLAEKAVAIAEGQNIARQLANTPANLLTPDVLKDFCANHFKKTSVKIDIINAKDAAKMGMNAFLSVAKGSTQEPFMLVFNYSPVKNQKPIALVGKGVTFDSGGISIKPSLGMGDMKGDMGGAAAVIGAMTTIAKLKPEQNVIAITPLVENMPSGGALKPGDVITAKNGKTIEVLNTDAEGRLILADALCLAVEKGAKEIIDIATLTGACSIALGRSASAILGNRKPLIAAFSKISEKTGERVWELPLYDDFLELLNSDVADIANANEDRLAGTATAAKFLEQFVSKTPWIHLDIASVMKNAATQGYKIKGMGGAGARSLAEYILSK